MAPGVAPVWPLASCGTVPQLPQTPGGRRVLWSLILFLVLGLIAGYIARALVPGEDPMTMPMTLALGVVGSFVGGLLGRVIFNAGDSIIQPSGIFGSIIGAVVVLMIYNYINGEKHSHA